MAHNSGLYGHYPGLVHPPPPLPESHLAASVSAGQIVQAAYNHNSNSIPGLAFGPSQSSAPGSSVHKDQDPAAAAQEDGEVSDDFDGEFEDLYEPKEPVTGASPPRPLPIARTAIPFIPHDRVDSATDADGSSIYDNGSPQPLETAAEGAVESTGTSQPAADDEYSPDEDWEPEPAQPPRQKSGSYSPYLSPSEVERRESATQPLASVRTDTQHAPQKPVSSTVPVQPPNTTPASQNTIRAPSINGGAKGNSCAATSASSDLHNNPTPVVSVSQAKKKAQEAILGLWSHKVRFQHYIEEGFDQDFIRKLFTELGLDASLSQPAAQQNAKSPAMNLGQSTGQLQPPVAKNSVASVSPTEKPASAEPTLEHASQTGEVPAPKTAAEERKERIARKLAAKAQKPATPVLSAQPMTVGAAYAARNSPALTAASQDASAKKAKTRAENNARIQQKLAALKQKELERAKAVGPSSAQAQDQTSEAIQSQAHAAHDEAASHRLAATPSAVPSSNGRDSLGLQNNGTRNSKSPGLTFSSENIPPNKSRNLKRPVASDFDDPPQRADTLKRTRTQDTFIIDVSDDEDVEMDIGSPAEDVDSAMQYSPGSTPHVSFATHPPLSDHPSRRLLSNSATPATTATPPKGAKLDLLHGRIEEMKRKIAEAEAKKTKSNTSTPVPEAFHGADSTGTSSPVVNSARLPKASEAHSGSRRSTGARDRMASYKKELEELDLREREFLQKITQERLTMQAELLALAQQEEEERLAELESAPALEQTYDETPHTSVDQSTDAHDELDVQGSAGPSPLDANVNNMLGIHNVESFTGEANAESAQEGANTALGQDDEDDDDDVEMAQSTSSSSDSELEEPRVDQSDAAEEGSADLTTSSEDTSSGSDEDESSAGSPNDKPSTDNEERIIDHQGRGHGVIATANSSQAHDIKDDSRNPDAIQAIDETRAHANNLGADPTKQVVKLDSSDRPLLTNFQAIHDTLPTVTDPLAYQSPLEYFRAYRFHPKFFDAVPSGLKSMTYSSRIDANKQICPEALAGEPCTKGDACEYQHFENMVVSEGEIITQLGSSDMFEGEAKARFIEGLKKVLNELKASKVKDFDSITKAIVHYRADFLEDKTKVLNLDGVVI